MPFIPLVCFASLILIYELVFHFSDWVPTMASVAVPCLEGITTLHHHLPQLSSGKECSGWAHYNFRKIICISIVCNLSFNLAPFHLLNAGWAVWWNVWEEELWKWAVWPTVPNATASTWIPTDPTRYPRSPWRLSSPTHSQPFYRLWSRVWDVLEKVSPLCCGCSLQVCPH